MIRHSVILAAIAATGLAGCAEPDQAATGLKGDEQAFAGTGRQQPFMAPGWKPGDRASWEQHLKVRTQGGQNDYAKIE
jgi:hypothetical protein